MLIYASYIANKRAKLRPLGFLLSLATLSASALSVLLFLVIFGVISTSANHIIPLFGMALGNSLNIFAQYIERLKSDIELSTETIEGKIALGANIEYALNENIKKSTKASLIPTINQLETVGIIHIPGVTVGMILAGANPLKAVSFQLVIMFMMVAIALFTTIFATRFCLHTLFGSIDRAKHH
jgi:putative ABC transport system permease protein